jgi:hypothetical protein
MELKLSRKTNMSFSAEIISESAPFLIVKIIFSAPFLIVKDLLPYYCNKNIINNSLF